MVPLHRQLRPTTYRNYHRLLQSVILLRLGATPLQQITLTDIKFVARVAGSIKGSHERCGLQAAQIIAASRRGGGALVFRAPPRILEAPPQPEFDGRPNQQLSMTSASSPPTCQFDYNSSSCWPPSTVAGVGEPLNFGAATLIQLRAGSR